MKVIYLILCLFTYLFVSCCDDCSVSNDQSQCEILSDDFVTFYTEEGICKAYDSRYESEVKLVSSVDGYKCYLPGSRIFTSVETISKNDFYMDNGYLDSNCLELISSHYDVILASRHISNKELLQDISTDDIIAYSPELYFYKDKFNYASIINTHTSKMYIINDKGACEEKHDFVYLFAHIGWVSNDSVSNSYHCY